MLVTVLTEESKLLVTKNIYFNNDDEEKYKTQFQKMKDRGVLTNDTDFDDDAWIVRVNDIEVKISMKMNEVLLRKALNASEVNMKIDDFRAGVKAYVLNVILQTSPKGIHEEIRYLYKLIKNVGFLELGKQNELKELIKNDTDASLFAGAFSILEFMGVSLPDEYAQVWYSKLDEIDNKRKTRQLPDFKSIFAFGQIVKDFIDTATEEEFIDYGTVILWWQICNRIPLRPTEFVLLSRNCVFKREDKYYLNLKRNKGKGNGSYEKMVINNDDGLNTYIDEVIRVDEDLFNLVNYYNEIMDKTFPNRDKDYLFDKSVHTERLFISNMKSKINKNRFTASNLRDTLYLFYEKIICNKYKKSICTKSQKKRDIEQKKENKEYKERYKDCIEILVPYDLRHIAIINLIMIGSEPLTVMKMAGHKEMRTTKGYYDHIEEYGRSYIQTYSKYLKGLKYNTVDRLSSDGKVNLKNLIDTGRKKSAISTWNSLENNNLEKINYKKVDGGLCKYMQSDLSPCYAVEGNHSRCPYFVPDENTDIEKRFYAETDNIKSVLKTIEYLTDNYNSIIDFSKKYSVAIEEFRDRLSNASMIASNIDSEVVESILEE